ncbi:nucleotidyltransferase domain-containing protein [Geochorda subterranea]|uniref:nucleotidyltransferase domain-containing protein n=1 Tax=Geochorda subterranea TaxID=3109564 RepID=UPI00386024E8
MTTCGSGRARRCDSSPGAVCARFSGACTRPCRLGPRAFPLRGAPGRDLRGASGLSGRDDGLRTGVSPFIAVHRSLSLLCPASLFTAAPFLAIGSRARQTAGRDGDIDLLVVLRELHDRLGTAVDIRLVLPSTSGYACSRMASSIVRPGR